MADYLSQHTGEQLDTAVQKALDITSTPANIDAAVAQELATIDYVVAQGTSGDWHYRKWNSGDVDLWLRKQLTNIATTTAVGNIYVSTVQAHNFPFTVYNATAIGSVGYNGAAYFPWLGNVVPWQGKVDFYIANSAAATLQTMALSLVVHGQWKE